VFCDERLLQPSLVASIRISTLVEMSAWPVGYFITFRTYATWLPGDSRGWIDRHHNGPDTPCRKPSASMHAHASRQLRSPVVRLDRRARSVVSTTIRDVCEHRDWSLQTHHVRSNHVHVILTAAQKPEPIMTTLKAWCTRRLREDGLVAADARVWSRHGSTLYLWTPQSYERARHYVDRMQD